jgi:hypothetical protein
MVPVAKTNGRALNTNISLGESRNRKGMRKMVAINRLIQITLRLPDAFLAAKFQRA